MNPIPDFYEIDFHPVASAKSGDAITMRFCLNGLPAIHVVDGGFTETGENVVSHIEQYYGNSAVVDRMVVTHPDGDHACGLKTVLSELLVRELWMLRPWIYAEQLLPAFPRFQTAEALRDRLREVYPHIAELEEIADQKGVPIFEPFQGAQIGPFRVLAPSPRRWIELIIASEKTPQSTGHEAASLQNLLAGLFTETVGALVRMVKAAWGQEQFSSEETSAENEMSVVQYAELLGERVLLTGDTGRAGLAEAAAYAPSIGLTLPGILRFQVPHHGGRRNVSTPLLDHWLGPRLPTRPSEDFARFTAIISSAKEDKDHPRKAVVRAMIHRGGRVLTTENGAICIRKNAPDRGWGAATPTPYPEEQEE